MLLEYPEVIKDIDAQDDNDMTAFMKGIQTVIYVFELKY